MFNSLQPHGHQASLSFTNSWSLFKLMSVESVMPSNHLTFCCPLLPLPSVFARINVSSNESALCITCQSIGDSTSVSVLPMNIQHWYPLGLTGLISLLSKGLLRSSPTPQLQSINSLTLSLLYGPTLTSLLDYCKKSVALTIYRPLFEKWYMCFLIHCLGLS